MILVHLNIQEKTNKLKPLEVWWALHHQHGKACTCTWFFLMGSSGGRGGRSLPPPASRNFTLHLLSAAKVLLCDNGSGACPLIFKFMFVCLQVPLEEGLNKTIQYFSRELEHQANNQYIPKPKAARMKKGRPRHNWGSCSLTTDSSETRSKAPSEALEASTYSEWSTLGTLYGEKDNYNKHNKRIVALLVFWMDGSWGKTPDWLFCFLLLKSQPWWRVAALIVLSMFVVYFSYFIGWLGGEVCVWGCLSRGEAPVCPLDFVLHQWCAIFLSAVHTVAPQDRPSPALTLGASLRVNQDIVVFCFVKCQDVHYQSQMLF